MNTDKMIVDYIKRNYDTLDDLTKRLQDDYNCIQEFEQYEEDRLVLYNILQLIDANELKNANELKLLCLLEELGDTTEIEQISK